MSVARRDGGKGREEGGEGSVCRRLSRKVREGVGMIQFILLLNKQGQTRLAKYYFDVSVEERMALEGELIRKCLSRVENQVQDADTR